ncbi:hypothetical protein D9613_012133 [Agrocybe pediades]|uniref:Uncharacterized protein n=1 Tax=Agrocybe pediades TaxID=84607 RepID=A0A8H4R2V2_9AGAR|nr:hypothetical protein D9613_012133 [Agrocybe pediades]
MAAIAFTNDLPDNLTGVRCDVLSETQRPLNQTNARAEVRVCSEAGEHSIVFKVVLQQRRSLLAYPPYVFYLERGGWMSSERMLMPSTQRRARNR